MARMSDTQKIQWTHLAVEGLAIIASILLAFAIDTWWDNRTGRIEERRILTALKAEFLSNAESIPVHIEMHLDSVRYTRALLNAMMAAEPGSTLQYPAARFGRVLGHTSTDPQSGALEAILQSGELRFIRNPAIRERLAAWPTLVVDATENEDLLRQIWDPKLLETLAKVADLSILEDVSIECWEDPTQEPCAALEINLPRNTEVMAYLATTAGWAEEGARELGILVEEAKETVRLIDAELAAR